MTDWESAIRFICAFWAGYLSHFLYCEVRRLLEREEP